MAAHYLASESSPELAGLEERIERAVDELQMAQAERDWGSSRHWVKELSRMRAERGVMLEGFYREVSTGRNRDWIVWAIAGAMMGTALAWLWAGRA